MSRADDLALALRRAYAPVLAQLLRVTRDLGAAEDAVQEAMARALATWPERGAPDSPEAWLCQVAIHVHRDSVRRRRRREEREILLERLVDRCPWGEEMVLRGAGPFRDDALGLVFTCCDPVLALEERAALALATVAGLSTAEIARAFLVQPAAMERRLGRARLRLRTRRGRYEEARQEEVPERLDAVLEVIRLVFNEGHWAASDDTPIRRDLVRLSLRMARALGELLPGEPEVQGLLALLLLHAARTPARLDARGLPLSLEQQDRSLWDRGLIEEARTLLRAALERGSPGPYQIEAAIAAVHCAAPCAAQTDWCEIALLYQQLERLRPDPIVRVNRAFAVGRAEGAVHGLRLLEAVADHPALARYAYAHLVRGVLLGELGRVAPARAALARARDLSRNRFERAQIEARMSALVAPPV